MKLQMWMNIHEKTISVLFTDWSDPIPRVGETVQVPSSVMSPVWGYFRVIGVKYILKMDSNDNMSIDTVDLLVEHQ